MIKSNSEKIKTLLKISEVSFCKEQNDQTISVKLKHFSHTFIFIIPECKDGEFIRVNDLTEFNPIKKFNLIWEGNYCQSELVPMLAKAFVLAGDYMKELEKEWINKDIRDFAKTIIDVKK